MNNTAPAPSSISGDDAAEKSHQFSAANVLLMCMIIGLCIFTSYMIKKFKCYRIPESAAAMTIGVVVGGVAKLAQPSQAEMKMLSFQPEIFFFLLLPPIIFEAGYTLNKKVRCVEPRAHIRFPSFPTLTSTHARTHRTHTHTTGRGILLYSHGL
jgi:sodium/hydrogen exchanger 8